jgi:hypothetical protein
MKPDPLIYASIPALPLRGFFQHFPGVYCAGCGETFALYSYSTGGPLHIDENGKPFYHSCFHCGPKPASP